MYQNPKSINELKRQHLTIELHQYLAEFSVKCHSQLNEGLYTFDLKASGECPDCTRQANLTADIEINIEHRKFLKDEVN